MKDILLKLMFSILQNNMNFIMTYHFLPERMKIEKVGKFIANLHDKTEYVKKFKASIKSWISFEKSS